MLIAYTTQKLLPYRVLAIRFLLLQFTPSVNWVLIVIIFLLLQKHK